MKAIFIVFFVSIGIVTYGSHIAGGEFRMTHINGFQFKIELVIYFDLANGNVGAKDNLISARIFRNSDNTFVRDVSLPLTSESTIGYNQSICAISFVQWTELIYSAGITLQPDIFNEPEGYYIVWERCCRNYGITNIYSDFPGVSLDGMPAGQSFFMEFPPVVKNNQLFINSSPQLKRPVADYTCVGYPYFADFSATDSDGDSLIYSMSTPWSTHTFDALPPDGPGAKPYPEVVWKPTFSSMNVMGGNSMLTINDSGLISVVPPLHGLFSFAVKCEEYRNGEKIGEVRREYQILSVSCVVQTPPVISAKTEGGLYSEHPINVHFDSTSIGEQRCVQVRVSDIDAATSPKEIRISAIPIGFDGNVTNILPTNVSATLTQNEPFAEFSICFDRCPPTMDKVFEVGIVAYDASCAIPLTDTVRITVVMDVPEGECQHQSIVFPDIGDRSINDSQFALNASSSSGLPVSYSTSSSGIITLSASNVSLLKPGRANITAYQAGDAQHLEAIPVKRIFCIEPPTPFLSISNNGSSLVLMSSSEDGNIWFRDGVFQENITGSSIPLPGESNDHIYTVRLLIDNCLSEASEPFTVTGLNNEGVQIFPNPVSEDLYLELSGSGHLQNNIYMYDIKGQMVFSDEIYGDKAVIDMRGRSTGIYILIVKDSFEFIRRKVFKK